MIAPSNARPNPFPGLRPFREDETQLFFGRENQVDTMVNKLAATRFLAVVGTSGSGKSSLVNCGLRPALHRGLMASAGPAWRIAQFRPGSDPIKSLAQALAAEGVLYSGEEEDVPLAEIVETYLHQSASGVIETFRKARLPPGTNLLIVADQFEELFRYSKLETAAGSDSYAASEKAIAFINLLLKAHIEPDCPIYVVLTMRSDFLGDCSQFYGLPEAINQGQYLVPRMTRDERRASIAGPVSVGGAEISPVLLTRLVNDVGDNPDQLSILQHALNRTWACWESHGAQGELNLDHYTEIGTMSEALNQHANEAFDLLEESQRKICEKLFKALTDLGTDPRGIRRPLKLEALAEIAATKSEEKEVAAVIEVFRDPSRAFLMPPAGESLGPQKVIDISHESLMRVWKRLRSWAEEESNSARRYRRLAETAMLEKAGNAALWSDPDLQLALDWKQEQTPTPTWASLYGGDFESASAFLEKSQSQRDHHLAEVIFTRHWNRIRRVIAILVVLVLVSNFHHYGKLKTWSEFDENAKFEVKFNSIRDFLDSLPIKNTKNLLLLLTCFLGPYFLGYAAIAYLAKRGYRRLAFTGIVREVARSSTKAVREQKAQQALGDAVVKLETTYASFWRRLGALVVDFALFIVGVILMVTAAMLLYPEAQSTAAQYLLFGLLLSIFGGHWLYHALMLSSHHQATLGMLALGILGTDENGNRLHFAKATLRDFAKILSAGLLGIGFFIQPYTPKRQTLHDLIAGSVVLVRPNKKKVRWWIIVICVFLGLLEALLAGILKLILWGI
jgi:uncharacterized RDD family membrane protein YckC/energy-coupling factor transporter ATP-binding protein EcfA2